MPNTGQQNKPQAAAFTVEGHLPGGSGWSAEIRDRVTGEGFLYLIVIAMLAALIYLVVHQENDRERRYGDTNSRLAELAITNRQIISNQQVILDYLKSSSQEQEIQTYVLTLNEAQRKALNLTMPRALIDRSRK